MCLMDTGKSEVGESGQNTTVIGDLISVEGSVPEKHVPGTCRNGRNPEQLKVYELKTCLACRGAPTKGKKADLVAW